jgi:hypothetical protein
MKILNYEIIIRRIPKSSDIKRWKRLKSKGHSIQALKEYRKMSKESLYNSVKYIQNL